MSRFESSSIQPEFLICIDLAWSCPIRNFFSPRSSNISFYQVSKIMWRATFQSLGTIYKHTMFRAISECLEIAALFASRGRGDSGSEFISIAAGDQRPPVLYISFHKLNFTDFLAVIPDLRQQEIKMRLREDSFLLKSPKRPDLALFHIRVNDSFGQKKLMKEINIRPNAKTDGFLQSFLTNQIHQCPLQ